MSFLGVHLSTTWQAVLATVVIGLMPTASFAAGMGFKNETGAVVIVQGQTLVNGQIKKGPQLPIQPGKTMWDPNLPAGKRTITITDPSGKLLYSAIVEFMGQDQGFAILPAPKGLRLEPRPLLMGP